MLNYGEKNCALRNKKKNILTLVLSEKKKLNETKNHNPPCKLIGRSLMQLVFGINISKTEHRGCQYRMQF
jgi:hypothetical protein